MTPGSVDSLLMRKTLPLTLLLCSLTPPLPARADPPPPPPPSSLSNPEPPRATDPFWTPGAPTREWRLVDHADPAEPRMTVTHTRTGEDAFALWFSGKPGQEGGLFNVEEFRLVRGDADPGGAGGPGGSGGGSWVWLDRYVDHDASTGSWVEHPVFSHRILFTPAGGETRDLVADGTYARGGGRGQPYLLADPRPARYRIQVWGTIAQEDPAVARWHWYWDAEVESGVTVVNPALGPAPLPALRVREAWWHNFDGEGVWSAPGGGEVGASGTPTGAGVRPFRTVWHAGEMVPYCVIGTPEGEPTWRVDRVRAVEPRTRP